MLLAVDTATASASVALFDRQHNTLLAETTWMARRRHTQDLTLTIQQLLDRAAITIEDVDALAVTTGPGSFTGVRIGISVIKGLGMGMQTEPAVIGLPTLAVTAAPWLKVAAASNPSTTVCAFIQAGRGRYNWAWFEPHELQKRPQADEHETGTATEFAEALANTQADSVWLAGELDKTLYDAVNHPVNNSINDTRDNAENVSERVVMLNTVSATRRAGHLAWLAALHLSAGTTDSLTALQPLYLRNP